MAFVPFAGSVSSALATAAGGAAFGASSAAAATGTAAFLATTASVVKLIAINAAISFGVQKLFGETLTTDSGQNVTARNAKAPVKIVYGEAWVSGPIIYMNVGAAKNRSFYHVISLCNHEVESFGDIWLDNDILDSTQFDGSGLYIDPTSKYRNVVQVWTETGTDAQNATPGTGMQEMIDRFPTDWDTAMRGRGTAHLFTRFFWEKDPDTSDRWEAGAPQQIAIIVKGRQVYDPRLDTSPGANPTNPTYIAWSDNPALCTADFLTLEELRGGWGWPHSAVDYDAIVTAADQCDVLVDVPPATQQQKRYTCNGVVFAGEDYETNLKNLLSSMNGTAVFSGGKWTIRAGQYEAPSHVVDSTWLRDNVTLRVGLEQGERFNTVRGLYVSPDHQYTDREFPYITGQSYQDRDRGQIKYRDIRLPFTNNIYMAQRLAFQQLYGSDMQRLITLPCNWKALSVVAGQRISLSIEPWGIQNEVYKVLEWKPSNEGGIDLLVRLDDAAVYADPAREDYREITDDVIEERSPEVESPTQLTAQPNAAGARLDWDLPGQTALSDTIEILTTESIQSDASGEYGLFTDAQLVSRTRAEAFDLPVTAGQKVAVWVRNRDTQDRRSDEYPGGGRSYVTVTSGGTADLYQNSTTDTNLPCLVQDVVAQVSTVFNITITADDVEDEQLLPANYGYVFRRAPAGTTTWTTLGIYPGTGQHWNLVWEPPVATLDFSETLTDQPGAGTYDYELILTSFQSGTVMNRQKVVITT